MDPLRGSYLHETPSPFLLLFPLLVLVLVALSAELPRVARTISTTSSCADNVRILGARLSALRFSTLIFALALETGVPLEHVRNIGDARDASPLPWRT